VRARRRDQHLPLRPAPDRRAKLHAVIGGFHLTGPLFEPIIDDTVRAPPAA